MFCPYCGEKILASKSGSEKEPSNSSGNNSGGSSSGGSGYASSGYNGGSGYVSSGYSGGSGYASSGYNGGSGYAGSGYNGGSGDSGYGGSGSSSSGTNSSGYNGGSGYAGSGYSSGGSSESGYSGSGYSSSGSSESGYSGSGYSSSGPGESGYSGSGYSSSGSGESGYSGSGYSSGGSGESGYSGSGYSSGGSSESGYSGSGYSSGGSGESGYSGSGYNSESGYGFGGGPDISNSSFEKRTDPPKLRGTGTVERMIHLGSGLVGFAPLIGMFFSLIMSLATHVIAGYIFRSYGAFVVFGFVKQIILVACLVIVVGILIGAFYLVMTGRTAQEQEFIIVLIASLIAVVYFVLLLLNKLMPLRIVLIIADLVLGIDLVAKLVTYGTGLCGNFNLAESFAVLKSRSVERQARSDTGNAGSGVYGSAAAGGAAAYNSLPSNENGLGGPGGPGSYGPQGGAPYPDANMGGSYFDGTGGELVGLLILTVLVSLITCGIATPWFLCKIYRWQKEHTVIDGKRLTFNGSGAELLGKWIIWEVLSAITCGLYGFYMAVALKKWEVSHTAYMGTQDIGGMPYQGSQFDGSFASYIGNRVLCNFLTSITCGIAYPWASVPLIKWEYTGSVVCRDRLGYFGNGSDMFKIYIINMLLTYITCGIYAPWAICRINRYICSNVHVIHRY